jgi:hypothetical protein
VELEGRVAERAVSRAGLRLAGGRAYGCRRRYVGGDSFPAGHRRIWGSLLQAFRTARPAWLSGLVVAIILPSGAHAIEFVALRVGHDPHIRTSMVVSIVISIGSLLTNWGLMSQGLLVTGDGADTLRNDLRHLPSALATMFRLFRGATK